MFSLWPTNEKQEKKNSVLLLCRICTTKARKEAMLRIEDLVTKAEDLPESQNLLQKKYLVLLPKSCFQICSGSTNKSIKH